MNISQLISHSIKSCLEQLHSIRRQYKAKKIVLHDTKAPNGKGFCTKDYTIIQENGIVHLYSSDMFTRYTQEFPHDPREVNHIVVNR